MSHEKVAEALGLTFQQVQKYEKGANRVSSSRLYDMARILDVPLSHFFEEMSAEVREQTPSEPMRSKKRSENDQEADPLAKRETMEFARAYYKMADPAVGKRVFELTKSIAKAAG